MKISVVTRAQPNVPFGLTDKVIFYLVTENTHLASFCVGHVMFDILSHRNFRVADHIVKGFYCF